MNPISRFTNRVDTYVKYRPSYPNELVNFFINELGLKPGQTIIDIGSGTGIFSELFLKHGFEVVGVEPNTEMRLAGEKFLGQYSKFKSIEGKSEETTLADKCADFITAAQAFHWFRPQQTKIEFQRILKPGGYATLVWNDRRTTGEPFAIEFESLINKFSTDYKKVNHKNIVEKDLRDFLGPASFGQKSFINFQDLNFDGLVGRLTSSSYAPNIDHPRYAEMVHALTEIFEKYKKLEKVRIEYDTKIYYGRLDS